MPSARPSSSSSSTRRRPDFWASLDEADQSGDLLETDVEASAFDKRVREEIQRKERLLLHSADTLDPDPSSSSPAAAVLDPGGTGLDGDELVFGLDHVTDEPAEMGSSRMLDTRDSNGTLPPAPSFQPHDIHTSTPLHLHSASFPTIPTPSHHTTSLPAPPVLPSHRASTSALHALRRTLETPPPIASPIDTPSASTSSRGEGRGRRDPPGTPVPLGSGAMGRLKGKKDLQTLTKHFEAFEKGVAKDNAAERSGATDRKGKGKARSAGQVGLGLGSKVFDGLRFCISPEIGAVSKHKTWWDIIAKMGGTVVIRPDTAITHVIYDGRSAALLARELGLDTLSELPEGTVCVKWDWVVKCKMANKVLETGPWLSFQKTAFNRAFSSNAAIREGSRMRDITTDLLRGRSISITKRREPSASDSETESPKKQRAAPSVLQRQPQPPKIVPQRSSEAAPTAPVEAYKSNATTHQAGRGSGWENPLSNKGDGLDELISGLKDGTIREEEDESVKETGHTNNVSDDENEGTNPCLVADKFKCGQNHDGADDKGPNEYLAKKFEEMYDLYQGVAGKDFFSVRNYRMAAGIMRRTPWPITKGADAAKIKGIGANLAERWIDEFLSGRTGRLFYEDTSQARAIAAFKDIYGVGKSQANELYKRGARSIDDLRANPERYGLTSGQQVGLELYDDLRARIPREECKAIYDLVRSEAMAIDSKLWIEIMGSYRRGQETSGDVDFLITRDTEGGGSHAGVMGKLVNRLRERGVITHELSQPHDWRALEAKWMGVGRATPEGKYRRIDGDILCIPFDQWGAALIYFTGNDIFNRSLRLYARKMGYSLNQRGLYKGVIRGKDGLKVTEGHIVASRTEKEIFDMLGLRWRHPHHRRP